MILSQFPKSKGFSILLTVFIASDVYGVPPAYTKQLEQNVTSLPNERVLKPNIGGRSRLWNRFTIPKRRTFSTNKIGVHSIINDIEPCLNGSFCDDPNYPLEMVNRVLDAAGIKMKLFNDDIVDEEIYQLPGTPGFVPSVAATPLEGFFPMAGFRPYFHHDDDEGILCPSEVILKQPRKGLARDGTYKFIANTDRVIQKLRLEICSDEGRKCSKVTGEGEGYTTACKQKYLSRRFMVIGTNGSLEYAIFPFPASCCCHAYLDPGALVSRKVEQSLR